MRIERRWKSRQPEAYLRRRNDPRGFVADAHPVDEADLPLEFTMNALRLPEGVPLALWSETTGLPEAVLVERLASARKKGLLVEDGQRVQASPRGLLFLNELLASIDES